MTIIKKIVECITGIIGCITGLDKAKIAKQLSEQITENRKLSSENYRLKEQLEMFQNERENPLVFKDGLYYSADDVDNANPYCPACYDNLKKKIHLFEKTCPICAAQFFKSSGPVHFL